MKTSVKSPFLPLCLLVAFLSLLQSPDMAQAMSIGRDETSPQDRESHRVQQPPERERALQNAPQEKQPLRFLGWEGKKLKTTAGAFVLDDSVEVVDIAGSRHLGPEFRGRLPAVQLIYKDKKLVKVVIE